MPYTFPPFSPTLPLSSMCETPRKGVCDKRAWHYCADLRRYSGGIVEVEWKKNSTWGAVASVSSWNGKCSDASGCGYCKGSTALAHALRFMGRTDEERRMIAGTGGCGYDTVRDALASCGWTLERMPGGRGSYASDIFRLSPVAEAIP